MQGLEPCEPGTNFCSSGYLQSRGGVRLSFCWGAHGVAEVPPVPRPRGLSPAPKGGREAGARGGGAGWESTLQTGGGRTRVGPRVLRRDLERQLNLVG